MTGPTRTSLSDLATRFPILPKRVADALDIYGPDQLVWVWVNGDVLVGLEVIQ
jgi:hypothetical protein